jgi:hypothetical protein
MITVIKISIARRIDGKMYLKNFNSALFNLGALSFFQVGKLRGRATQSIVLASST